MRHPRLAVLTLLAALVGGGLAAPQLAGTATADVTVESGTPLPAIPAGTKLINLALDGDTAYAGVRTLPDPGSGPVTIYRTASDGTGDSWTPVTDPLTSQPLVQDVLPEVNEGRVLVAGPQDNGTPCSDYRILGASAKSFSSCVPPHLVGGGRLIRGDSASEWRLEQNDGSLLASFVHSVLVDGDRAWWAQGSPRQVVGQDLSTGDPLAALSIPSNCGFTGLPRVGGDYVVVGCSSFGGSALLDATRVVPAYPLGAGFLWVGDGFGGHQVIADGTMTFEVVDFGQGKATHRFATSTAGRPAVDSSGSARVIFETPDLGVAVGDIGPLAARNSTAEDVTPPTVVVGTRPGPFRRPYGTDTVQLDYGWSGVDPGLPTPLRYDTREANYYVTDPQPYYNLLTATTSTTYTTQADARTTRWNCFQVRSRDWAGNLSAWTNPACTLVDGEPPWVQWVTSSWDPFLHTLASSPIRLTWKGMDAGGLTTSKLQYRLAPPGSAGVTWQVPSGWNALTTKSVSRSFQAGSTVCFRVQMRDRAGNISPFKDPGTRCLSVPYDDRSFTSAGPVHRGRSSLMLGGTYTRLNGSTSWLIRKGIRVRALDIRVGGDFAARPQVFLGATRISGNTFSIYGDGQRHWLRFYFGRSLTGTLRIRGDRYYPLSVDAIAVEH